MRKLTVNDLRVAVMYVNQGNEKVKNLQDVSDEELLSYSFSKDLHMGNIRFANVMIEIERRGHEVSADIPKIMPDDTVKSFFNAVNKNL